MEYTMKNEINVNNIDETTGEELLQEYLSQDKDNSHKMGYDVYMQTHSESSGCCC